MNQGVLQRLPFQLILLAFMEGAAVIAVEVLGAKMLTPYYGNSLKIWATVLGVTLLGLAGGYFLGGRSSSSPRSYKRLVIVAIPVVVLMILMPLNVQFLIRASQSLKFHAGAFVAAFFLLFPPLLLLGSLLPVIIRQVVMRIGNAARGTAFIMAASAVGNIFTLFFLAFVVVPKWGITYPMLIVSLTVAIVFFISFFREMKKASLALLVISLGLASFLVYKKEHSGQLPYKILEVSEGVMGQLEVIEYPHHQNNLPVRELHINNIPQTIAYYMEPPYSLWGYVHRVAAYASAKPNGSALLFGMGGGSIVSELQRLNYNVDIVEIDGRIPKLAEKYLKFDPSKGISSIVVDDARHYIKTQKDTKHDLIIFDVVNAEVQPYYLFTKECFEEVAGIIKDDGIILINYQGYINGKKGLVTRSILKTFESAGFITYYWHGDPNKFTDIFLIAAKKPFNFEAIKHTQLNDCCMQQYFMNDFRNNPVVRQPLNLEDAYIFTDDKPLMENLNSQALMEWRSNIIEGYGNEELGSGFQLFK